MRTGRRAGRKFECQGRCTARIGVKHPRCRDAAKLEPRSQHVGKDKLSRRRSSRHLGGQRVGDRVTRLNANPVPHIRSLRRAELNKRVRGCAGRALTHIGHNTVRNRARRTVRHRRSIGHTVGACCSAGRKREREGRRAACVRNEGPRRRHAIKVEPCSQRIAQNEILCRIATRHLGCQRVGDRIPRLNTNTVAHIRCFG